MKRIIKRFDVVTSVHLDLISQAYPEGFSDEDLVSMHTVHGERLRCLEVRTEDTLYLFRIDAGMVELIEEELGLELGDVELPEDDDI
jgi:DNA-directed RNA polymerase subunit delta